MDGRRTERREAPGNRIRLTGQLVRPRPLLLSGHTRAQSHTGGGDAGMTAGGPMPTQDDVLGYFDTLSNWGRWGDDDELGTLNHITDDVRLAAARAVRHGRGGSGGGGGSVPGGVARAASACPCARGM